MRLLAACLSLLLLATSAAAQQPDPQRLEAARRVVIASGVAEQAVLMVGQLGPQLLAGELKDEDVPPELIPLISESIAEELKANPSLTRNKLAAIYADKFTLPQLEAAARYYESPEGRALVTGSMALTADFQAAGVEIITEIMPRAMERLKVKAEALDAASAPRAGSTPAPAWTRAKPPG